MKKYIILNIIILMGLSNCGTGGIGMAGSPAWEMTAPESSKRAHYQAICLDKGYELGSSEMDVCIRGKPKDPNRRKSTSFSCQTIGNYTYCD